MNITYTQKLIDYLTRKEIAAITIDIVDSGTSTSGFVDICATPVSAKVLAKIEAEGSILKRFDAPVGELIVLTRGLEYDEDVTLDLRSFLGIKDIRIDGIRAWSF